MNQDIKDKIRKEIKSIAFADVLNDASLIKSGVLDSIDIVDLIIFIEENTGINIPNNDINEENFDTIDRLMLYLIDRAKN